jgi:general secretion pathway protein G
MSMRKRKGFTLVEILIVVVILGILAAIVIPQFSDASTQSKVSSAKSSLQTLRSQISLYKIQHNDTAPALDTFVAQMTGVTNVAGTVNPNGAQTRDAANGYVYGPYLQAMPNNPFNNEAGLAAAAAAGNGWVYIAGTGDIDLDTTDISDATVKADAANW